MIVLAIETATPACALALEVDGSVTEEVLDLERHHTEALVPGVARLLGAAGVAPGAIERVVVDRGPGLYTGLRVGIATALGLALATGADLVAVTSLEVLAAAAARAGARGELVALVDGRRGEVFAQRFSLEPLAALDAPRVLRPEALAPELAARPALLGGDGALRYREAFAGSEAIDLAVPPPSAALELSRGRDALEAVLPLYLREADAVANFSTRTRAT
ncbi:MAG TPA: tRNA (adenosine(37)-N6)-threonylcarbamoyltransferase complex dimerization subunit type 1 TsaB [Acidimicrobiales bacterium]|nr:tRNA (adenosine(37)-N6)-threonylcarbamoyltransferase complex dimerization subunit type 1 TsaB [Acidimicrobiales bacterium]